MLAAKKKADFPEERTGLESWQPPLSVSVDEGLHFRRSCPRPCKFYFYLDQALTDEDKVPVRKEDPLLFG